MFYREHEVDEIIIHDWEYPETALVLNVACDGPDEEDDLGNDSNVVATYHEATRSWFWEYVGE